MLNIEHAQQRLRDREATERTRQERIKFPLIPVILLLLILGAIAALAIHCQHERITIQALLEIQAQEENLK